MGKKPVDIHGSDIFNCPKDALFISYAAMVFNKSINDMKKVIYLLCLMLGIVSCDNNEGFSKDLNAISKEEAKNLLHQWTDAYLANDPEPLNHILDDSWIYSGSSDGNVTDKKSTIEEFSNADYRFGEITYDHLNVRLYDDIAVLRGTEKMLIIDSTGKDTVEVHLRFTDVYQKKNGVIKAISTHSSPIE
ncbi:nuclear transport factor 2 family protein [Robiginitalea sp. M366]|uniref:nuclear transport factor 2 family protein n=1 Tax=Robiginitalea aestuariiviva TaxID=3036903 RepID=UPI00240D75FB|nr:nuclear transport factor 2 family protein [Robiginitalea aestuariiviva]MDG1572656.1 nuclear transport factor 2 family protein [Robiginitalea aestuariiviva]